MIKRTLKQRMRYFSLMVVIFGMGSFVATQFTAVHLHFPPALGKPIITSLKLYNPFRFWYWVYQYGDRPDMSLSFTAGWWCIGVALFIIFVFAVVINLLEHLSKQRADTHGSAHFAIHNEVKKSGLIAFKRENKKNKNESESESKNAVYVGAYENTLTGKQYYLTDSSMTHVFAFAPSRSGKGVGLIIPTLLSYQSSVIISDFKLENWHFTAGFRKSIGHVVLKFDPTCTDGSSACFNPLKEIRFRQHEVRDVQLIADMLVDPDGKGNHNHWSNAANSLLVSVILHVLYAEQDKSLAGVRAFLTNPHCSVEESLQAMLSATHDAGYQYGWVDPITKIATATHPIVASGAQEMLNKCEEERNSIISSALTYLKLYRDPIIANNTRGHDFKIMDFIEHKKPISLYLGIPPSDLTRIMSLMRLLLQMILSRLTESPAMYTENPTRRQVLLMLDEFPQFGKLPFFEKALSYSAGYNIRAYLISQDMQQIYQEYGAHQSILSNCGIRIAYAPNTLETAKHLSELLGATTLRHQHTNYSGKRFNYLLNNMSINEQEIKRPLLTPDELMRLPQDVALIFKNGIAPIYGKKIYYYLDALFDQCSRIAVPERSDVIV
jgi:type IV secretion system protein VirD4